MSALQNHNNLEFSSLQYLFEALPQTHSIRQTTMIAKQNQSQKKILKREKKKKVK